MVHYNDLCPCPLLEGDRENVLLVLGGDEAQGVAGGVGEGVVQRRAD